LWQWGVRTGKGGKREGKGRRGIFGLFFIFIFGEKGQCVLRTGEETRGAGG
jgi:hypothetical protein